jgi:hypothetical protein
MATNSAGSDGAHATGRNNGKGLRHFSMKVCEKVESKGRTTYNEVADELVGEFSGAPTILPFVSTDCAAALHCCAPVIHVPHRGSNAESPCTRNME